MILFGYFNPFFRFGLEAFRLPSRGVGRGRRAVRRSAARGERRAKTVDRRSRIGLDFFFSPTSGADRIELVGRARAEVSFTMFR